MRRLPPVLLAALSGLLLGVGLAVLLQQFAVWTLNVVTLVLFPVLVALAGASLTGMVRRRTRVGVL